MTEDIEWFVGFDWASQTHVVCLLDRNGETVGERKVAHGGADLSELCDWLVARSGAPPARIGVAIETPHGPVVETLLERGFAVFAINPKQLDRFRDRFTVAGAKDDRRDGHVLADSLRTDRRAFRRLAVDDPTLVELREWSPLIASVIVAIIIIPKKKTSSPCVKEKRKAGTRAGLTKPAIVAAAAKLIESVGANGFSLRKLAKALGVGPTTVHFHFEGGVGSVFSAVAQQALAGVTRPFKPKEEPAGYLGELLLKILEALHARPTVAKLVVIQLSSNPVLDPLLAERLLLALAALGVPTEARPKMFQADDGRHLRNDLGGVRAFQRGGAEADLGEGPQDDCGPAVDGVSKFDGIARGNRRRGCSGRSGEAVSRGRRRIHGPAHRNPRRQVAARR